MMLSIGRQGTVITEFRTVLNVHNRPIQVKLIGIGSFLKLRMVEKPKRSPQNPYGQVSISLFKVWGTLRTYNISDHTEEVFG